MAEQYTLEEWMGKKPKRKLKKRSLHEAGPRFDVRDTDDMPDPLDHGEPKFSFKDAVKRAADKDYPADYTPVFYGGFVDDTHTLEEWMGMMEEAGVNLNELSPELLRRAGTKRWDQSDSAFLKAGDQSLDPSTREKLSIAWTRLADLGNRLSSYGADKHEKNQDAIYSLDVSPATMRKLSLEEWIDALQEVGVELGEGIAWPDAIDGTGRPSSYVPGKPLSRAEAERLGMVMYPHDGPDDTPFDPEVHNPRLANKLPIPTSSPTTDPDDVDTEDLVGTDRLSVGKTRTRKITDPNWNRMAKRLRSANPSPQLEEGRWRADKDREIKKSKKDAWYERQGVNNPDIDPSGGAINAPERARSQGRQAIQQGRPLSPATQRTIRNASKMDEQYTLDEGNPQTKKKRQDFDATQHPENEKLPKSHPLAKAFATHKGRQVYKTLPTDRLEQDFETRHDIPHSYEDDGNLSGKIAQARQNQAARMRDAYKNPAPLPGTDAGDRAITRRNRMDAMDRNNRPRNVFFTNTDTVTYPTEMDEQYTLDELIGLMTEAGGDAEEIKRLTKALEDAMKARGPASSMLDIKEKLKALQTARKAAKQKSAMTEQYTLEEWMGMMEEAGYSLEEGNKENKAKKNAATAEKGMPGETHFQSGDSFKAHVNKEARAKRLARLKDKKDSDGSSSISTAYKHIRQTPWHPLGGKTPSELASMGKGEIRRRAKEGPKPNLPTESISENTVSRLQELAGIKPLND